MINKEFIVKRDAVMEWWHSLTDEERQATTQQYAKRNSIHTTPTWRELTGQEIEAIYERIENNV